jgi:hypothetical protein
MNGENENKSRSATIGKNSQFDGIKTTKLMILVLAKTEQESHNTIDTRPSQTDYSRNPTAHRRLSWKCPSPMKPTPIPSYPYPSTPLKITRQKGKKTRETPKRNHTPQITD